MDQFDQAQELDARFLRQAIDEQLRKGRSAAGPSRELCLECEEPIPQRRREAQPGCTHCVTCAELIEKGHL